MEGVDVRGEEETCEGLRHCFAKVAGAQELNGKGEHARLHEVNEAGGAGGACGQRLLHRGRTHWLRVQVVLRKKK